MRIQKANNMQVEGVGQQINPELLPTGRREGHKMQDQVCGSVKLRILFAIGKKGFRETALLSMHANHI